MLLTRFNLPSQGLESLIRAREGWLRHRIDLFETYCAPSVAAQTRPGTHWVVYLDPASPGWLMDRIRPYEEQGLLRPVLRESVSREELVSDLRETVGAPQAYLATTNLDNDDGLAVDFSERLSATAPIDAPQAVYFVTGLIKSPCGLYLRRDRRNAFCSVVETWASPVTCWAEYHNRLPTIMPALEVAGGPGWLQVVHGENVSNRVRGRLVAPDRFEREFGSLIDDARTPSRAELTRDRLLQAPGRLVRDTARSGLRAVALRLLGKDRFSEIKRQLSARLRSR